MSGTYEEQLAWRNVTVRNGDRLREILAGSGWPITTRVGTAAARAARLIAQHADRQLDVRREALRPMSEAVSAGAADPRQLAMPDDRVRVDEGRRQRFGTRIAGIADGRPVPWPCTDPDHLDEMRAEVGLAPFEVHIGEFAGPGDAPS